MIVTIFSALITAFLVYFLLLVMVLQYIYLTDFWQAGVTPLSVCFEWHYLFLEQYSNLILVCKIIAFLFFVYMLFKDVGVRIAKSKYQKNSYTKLLTKFQRKRGTIRVQYNDKGEITRHTLECYWDDFFKPITKAQNKIASHFLLPEPKKINTVYDFLDYNGELKNHCSGIPVIAYRKYFLFGKFNRIYYLRNVIHSLFVGMSGRGKSETFVLPMLQSNIDAKESAFVHDPKGEILATMRQPLMDAGYKVIVLNFVEPELSEGWNPLAYPYDRWKKASNEDKSEAIELVLDISRVISYQEDAQNPFWHEGAGDMIAAAAYFLMEEGKEEYVNFTSINYLYQLGLQNDVLFKYLDKMRQPEDQSVLKIDTFRSAEGITRSGLQATFKNKMSLLTATPQIQKLLGSNTWTFDEVFDKKTAIFMITHDEKSTYYPLVTIFLSQFYQAAIKWTRDHQEKYNNKLKIPFNMYIDEMGLLPEIKDIEAIYGAARSRGIHMHCFFQSFAQLVQKYEVEGAKIIQDNSTHTTYLGSKLKEVADEFERIAGDTLYYDKKNREWKERPTITSEKLQKFEKGRSLVTALEWDPFVSKLPPYSKYVFAKKANWEKIQIYKPPVKWFDIREVYKEEQKNSYEAKGATVTNFNNLAEGF